MIKKIENANDLDIKNLKGKTFILFSADWCGMCVMLKPEVQKFAEKHPEVNVLTVDVDENRDLARQWSINSIPAYFVFEDNIQKFGGVGYNTVDKLEKIAGF
ncbi:thioredoxin family protein [Mycoplasma sp. 128]|uniref:thioredoxin family protein n=1 Tax=Mycoplasma sp. 3341 TaxID=3447506 RepID=UPI003F65E61C